ncbi:uncharacterized protein VTP21DRAFT_5146 [Calcarisporiella thermophila]|uniref:uncharacterized protein n=1 Tax=Calcarisporiella thermophila TaxID=911321 RepID=UPI003742F318
MYIPTFLQLFVLLLLLLLPSEAFPNNTCYLMCMLDRPSHVCANGVCTLIIGDPPSLSECPCDDNEFCYNGSCIRKGLLGGSCQGEDHCEKDLVCDLDDRTCLPQEVARSSAPVLIGTTRTTLAASATIPLTATGQPTSTSRAGITEGTPDPPSSAPGDSSSINIGMFALIFGCILVLVALCLLMPVYLRCKRARLRHPGAPREDRPPSYYAMPYSTRYQIMDDGTLVDEPLPVYIPPDAPPPKYEMALASALRDDPPIVVERSYLFLSASMRLAASSTQPVCRRPQT